MYLGTEFVQTQYVRTSKRGKHHTYSRNKTIALFRCDACQGVFKRDKGSMDPKRLDNKYYHVCSNCDAKKFAQEKGVESRRVWDMPVSSLKTLGQFGN
jgi:uncharacterized protein YlaI